MSILKLFIATVFPALISLGFRTLQKKTGFSKLSYINQQLVIGLVFGGYAIFCTEFGVNLNGAILNVRDSAPLCAGLLFGGPAGIIAGSIGGIYRWFCVLWDGGEFTRLACSLATVIAGLTAALLRKIMFDDKLPGVNFALGIGIGTETLHMLLVLLTNISQMSMAFTFVRQCAVPMIICNAIAVSLADIVLEKNQFKKPEKPLPLLYSFSNSLIACILIVFVITGATTYVVNTGIAKNEAKTLLSRHMSDIVSHIENEGFTDNLSTWRVGQGGGTVICNSNGDVISASQNGKALAVDSASLDTENIIKENTFYKTIINGEKIYCEYTSANGYYVFVYMPVDEADLSTNVTIYMMLFSEILIYIAIFCLVYQLVRKKMMQHLQEVNTSLNQITQGNLDTVVNVDSSKEFAELSNDINHTVDALKGHIKEAENRIERELELARQIQKSAVPFIFPPFPKRKDFDIYALMNTAKEVGGDFYDFYFTDDNHFAFLIADVSGKGIPAAMFMMASKTLIKGLAERGKTVEEVFSETNEKLCTGNDAGMFVTAWMGVINLETGHMAYANAGHNPPLLCRRDGNFEYIKEKPNFILAGMENSPYKKHDLYLNPGDTIYLYTDGVTEAENPNHKLYGEDRLERILQKVKNSAPREICKAVENDVFEFANKAQQSDDITMLAFKLNYLQSFKSICVHPDSASLELVTDYVDQKLSMLNISPSVRNKVQITVDEVFSNIQNYGNASKAQISFGFENEQLDITFTDNGEPFDPTQAQTPDITLSAEERKIGGLGIYLVKKLSSSYSYEYKDSANNLNVVFDLKDQENNI